MIHFISIHAHDVFYLFCLLLILVPRARRFLRVCLVITQILDKSRFFGIPLYCGFGLLFLSVFVLGWIGWHGFGLIGWRTNKICTWMPYDYYLKIINVFKNLEKKKKENKKILQEKMNL